MVKVMEWPLLNFHPDIQDLTHPDSKTLYIGYWGSNKDPECCYYAQEGIILPWPGDFVDLSWDLLERNLVADYLDQAPNVEFWRGYPFCRLGCKDCDLGTTDKGDGTYTWPAGFSHYLREHGVKPPEKFIKHILSKVK